MVLDLQTSTVSNTKQSPNLIALRGAKDAETEKSPTASGLKRRGLCGRQGCRA